MGWGAKQSRFRSGRDGVGGAAWAVEWEVFGGELRGAGFEFLLAAWGRREEGEGEDAEGVGEEVGPVEVGAEEAGGEADGQMIAAGEGGGDAGELEGLDGEEDEGGGEGDVPDAAGEAEQDADHGGVEGIAEVFIEEGMAGVEGAGEDAGGDDEQEGGEPEGVVGWGSGHEVMVAGVAGGI